MIVTGVSCHHWGSKSGTLSVAVAHVLFDISNLVKGSLVPPSEVRQHCWGR